MATHMDTHFYCMDSTSSYDSDAQQNIAMTYDFRHFTLFVKTIWNLTDSQLALFHRRVDSHLWILDEVALSEFKAAMSLVASNPEASPYPESYLYPPFQQLCNLFFETMEKTDEITLSAHPIRVWQNVDNGQSLLHAQPELLFIPKSDFDDIVSAKWQARPSWGRVIFPMEITSCWYGKLWRGHFTPRYAVEELPKVTQTIKAANKKRSPPILPLPKLAQTDSAASRVKTSPESLDPPAPILLSRKRKAPEDFLLPEPKRRYYKERDGQLGEYVADIFEATYRFFCSGLSLHNENIRIWYYDTMGTLSTIEFTLTANPRALMLVLFGMRLSDPRSAGYNIFHKAKDGTTAFQWRDSYFEFNSPKKPEDKFKYLVDGDSPLFMAREVSRRRTAVFPVLGQDENGHHSLLALKFSWLARNMRRPETDTVAMILQRAPELARYLPKFHFHRLYNAEHELGLPRYGLTKRVEHVVDTDGHRDLLVSVASRYAALWQVDTIEDFKTAFIDVVKCHYKTFTKGKVLHRDVSEGNIMFGRDDQGLHGVLLDFDNASDVNGNGDDSLETHRTGTAPFMALGLLLDKNPVHRYRHDLESFFYFLVWAAVHFDLPNKCRLPTPNVLLSWYRQDTDGFSRAYDAKASFMFSEFSSRTVFEACRPEFIPLWKTWIVPLKNMFFRSSVTVRFAQEDEIEVDAETLCGTLTYEKFMNALGVSTA